MSWGKKEKTVVRAVRFPKEIDDILVAEARRRKTTINNLLYGMLVKYVEWDRYADRFGFRSLMPGTLKSILSATKPEELPRVAHGMATNHMKEWLTFRFNEVSVRSWKINTTLFVKYAELGEFQIQPRSDGKSLDAIYKHDLGPIWSSLIGPYCREMYANLLDGPPFPEVEPTSDSIIIRGIPIDNVPPERPSLVIR